MEDLLKKNQPLLIPFLIGFILIGLGVFLFKNGGFSKSDSVEVLDSTSEGEGTLSEVVVEISGAVEKPGVYKLAGGSRIDDLLILAGGLSADANRSWVEKTINRASKLVDGTKYYIPREGDQSEVLSANTGGGIKLDQDNFGGQGSSLININSASLTQLDTLPGIGPVYGQNIIEQRPYSNIEELLSREVLRPSTYEKIKNLISVY